MTELSASAYLAYKQDTNFFVSWLGTTARACGWKSPKDPKAKTPTKQEEAVTIAPAPLSKGQRLKGKDRKEAKAKAAAAAAFEASLVKARSQSAQNQQAAPNKPATKHVITTDQLIQQIDLIAAKSADSGASTLKMPPAVHNALNRAVRAREKFAAWYQKTGSGTDPALDGHVYFIQQLRKAWDLLVPDSSPRSTLPAPGVTDTDKADLVMANMFAALDFEEITDDDDDDQEHAPFVHQVKQVSSFNFELQETEADVDFAIFSLFGDIHRIRTEVKEIIRRLSAGEIGLLQATLSISAALELVRQADEEVLALIKTVYRDIAEHFREGSYPSYLDRIYSSKALGRQNESKSQLKLGPFDDFVMLPLGYTLERIRYMAEIHDKDTDHTDFPPMRLFREFVDNFDSENLDDPRVRKGEADDAFIVQMYHDMLFLERLKDGRLDHMVQPPPDYQMPSGLNMRADQLKPMVLNSTLSYFDVLHNALRPIWTESVISMQSLFAAQTLIDIHDLSEPCIPGTQRQVQEARHYAERLDFVKKKPTGETWMRDVALFHTSESMQLVDKLLSLVKRQLTLDPEWTRVKVATLMGTHEMREEWVRDVFSPVHKDRRRLLPAGWEPPKSHYLDDPWAVNITGIWPNDSPTFLMDNNPLYGGTAILDMFSCYELVSVAVANESMAIMCMAYLYRASRQLGLLQTAWAEMDRVIALQVAAIFANDIPMTPRAMYDRFKYRICFGLSKGQMSKRSVMLSMYEAADAPWKLKPSQASTMIRQMLNAQVSLPRLLYWLENEALQTSVADRRKLPTNSTKTSTAITSESKLSPAASPERSVDEAFIPPTAKVGSNYPTRRQLSLRQSLRRIEHHLDAVAPDVDYLNLTRVCAHQLARLYQKLATKFGVKFTVKGSKYDGYMSGVEMTIGILKENAQQADAFAEASARRRKRRNLGEGDEDEVKAVGRQLEYAARRLGRMLASKEGPGSAVAGGD